MWYRSPQTKRALFRAPFVEFAFIRLDVVDVDDVAPTVDLDHDRVAVLPGIEAHDVAGAIDGLNLVEAVVLHDLLGLPAADAVIVAAIDRVIAGVAVAAAIIAADTDADTEVEVDIGFRLSRRRRDNRSRQRSGS